MKKLLIIFSIVMTVLIVSCQKKEQLPIVNPEKIEIVFIINGNIYRTETFDALPEHDFNKTVIPTLGYEEFLGWFYDSFATNPYKSDDLIESSTTLYAGIKTTHYTISFETNSEDFIRDQSVNKGNTVNEPPIPFKDNHEFLGWYKDSTFDNIYDFNEEVHSDFTLYAKWKNLIEDQKFTISFDTDGGNLLADIETLKGSLIDMPSVPIKEGYLFEGWFIDSAKTIKFDFNSQVSIDMTLYAKWKLKFEPGDIEYFIDGTILSFTEVESALLYHLYLGSDSTTPILSTSPSFDLASYESKLINKTNLEVYAEFDFGQNLKMFDLDVQFVSNSLVYQTGFEESEFVASTSYNNATPKTTGPVENSWSYVGGSVSTTQPLEGTKSFQFRWYQEIALNYLEMNFTVKNINKVVFNAKSALHDLKVKYYVDGVLSSNVTNINLDDTNKEYTVNILESGNIKIRFELISGSTSTTARQLYLDNIRLLSNDSGKTLVEIPKVIPNDYPETDESKLQNLKDRFASDRNKLGAPTFTNALSQSGLVQYYASLNGLTGDAFKTELENILQSTHQRLLSYGETRFILEKSDLITDNQNRQYLDGLYASTKIVKYWDGGSTWSREHVWPNSRLGVPGVKNEDKNQASDAHNLRAINASVNSSRSNRYFVQGTQNTNHAVGSTGYYPGDEYIGDVARILFYMVARYPNILKLVESNIDRGTTYTESAAYMGVLSVLLQWHEQDPVSEFEINRNNVIYSYQGNRNPFIDHPEYVNYYFN